MLPIPSFPAIDNEHMNLCQVIGSFAVLTLDVWIFVCVLLTAVSPLPTPANKEETFMLVAGWPTFSAST